MKLSINRKLKSALPVQSTLREDGIELYFTEDFGIYVNKNDGSIVQMGIDTATKTKIDKIDTIESSVTQTLTDAKAYTDQKVAGLVNSAPEALDTLKELADALGNDANFATTVTNQIATKADAATVTSQLATKADTETVTTQLAAKADTETVTTQLAAKADTTALETLKTELEEKIQEVAEGSVTGTAEW